MPYFRILDMGDDQDPGQWFLDVPRHSTAGEADPWQFTSGQTFRSPFQPLHVSQLVRGTPVPLSFAAFNIPIARADVATAIGRMACDDIQLLPLEVEGTDERYFVVNVTSVLRCLDERASEFTKFPHNDKFGRSGRYSSVSRLRVDGSALQGHHAVRVQGFDAAIIVSAGLRAAISAFPVPGLLFEEV